MFVHDPGFATRPLVEALLVRGFSVLELELGDTSAELARALESKGEWGLLIGQGRAANELLRRAEGIPGAQALALLASDVEPSTCDVIKAWKKPLFVVHSTNDEKVSIARAEAVFQAAFQPKSFAALEAGDHGLSAPVDARRAADLIADWAAPRWPTEPRSPHEKSQHGDVTVSWLGEGLAHVMHAPPHHWLSDEPPELKGEERGPNPYDMLLGALGACTAMTVRMYANLKGWPLEAMTVRLRHARMHAKDCEDCETKEGMIDRIEREVQLGGPLSEAQLTRLMEIVNKCPIHRTLTSEIRIPTKRVP